MTSEHAPGNHERPYTLVLLFLGLLLGSLSLAFNGALAEHGAVGSQVSEGLVMPGGILVFLVQFLGVEPLTRAWLVTTIIGNLLFFSLIWWVVLRTVRRRIARRWAGRANRASRMEKCFRLPALRRHVPSVRGRCM